MSEREVLTIPTSETNAAGGSAWAFLDLLTELLVGVDSEHRNVKEHVVYDSTVKNAA